jgi:hypothetical protein
MANKNILVGAALGACAGVLDVIPMFIQKLTWDANLSAFSMWIICGIFISTSKLNLSGILKGIIFSFLTLLPCAFLIGWHSPVALVPIFIMTLILGSLLGFTISKICKEE